MSIITQTLNSGQYGVPYSQTLTVTGGQPGDYQWSATGLPNGLNLSTDGVLSGSPQTTGTFSVEITVTDSTGATAAVSAYYTITLTFPPLQITTPSLNSGQDTVAYSSQTLAATGGTAMEFPPSDRAAMYIWSATGLPTGLNLSSSGVLSGTPTQSGTFTPHITVGDAAANVPSVTQTVHAEHRTRATHLHDDDADRHPGAELLRSDRRPRRPGALQHLAPVRVASHGPALQRRHHHRHRDRRSRRLPVHHRRRRQPRQPGDSPGNVQYGDRAQRDQPRPERGAAAPATRLGPGMSSSRQPHSRRSRAR